MREGTSPCSGVMHILGPWTFLHRICVSLYARALESCSSACQHAGLLSIVLEQFYLINKNRSKITFGKQHIFKRKRRSE